MGLPVNGFLSTQVTGTTHFLSLGSLFNAVLTRGSRPDVSRTRSFASPCIRSSLTARNHDSACTERPSIETDPSRFRCFIQALLRSRPTPRVRPEAASSLQEHALRDQSRLEEPPQGYDQLARQSNNRNAPYAALSVRHAD